METDPKIVALVEQTAAAIDGAVRQALADYMDAEAGVNAEWQIETVQKKATHSWLIPWGEAVLAQKHQRVLRQPYAVPLVHVRLYWGGALRLLVYFRKAELEEHDERLAATLSEHTGLRVRMERVIGRMNQPTADNPTRREP